MSDNWKSDAANYRRLQEPKPVEEVEANVKRFVEGIEALRKECSIPECFYVMKLYVAYPDGHEGETMAVGMLGAALSMESLAAFGFGYAGAERQKIISDTAADAASVKKIKRML